MEDDFLDLYRTELRMRTEIQMRAGRKSVKPLKWEID
jgi:hypothetical protein